MITASDKARELINMYYGHSKSQLEAIEIVERVVLTTMCQKIDSLNDHVIIKNDYDFDLIKSSIIQLKWQQEIAAELEKIKNQIPVPPNP